MDQIALAIHGAAGRMGRRLVGLAAEDDGLRVAAALESVAHPELGQDAGTLAGTRPLGVVLTAELNSPVDCLIDFSIPEACPHVLELCSRNGIPLVLATTGLTDAMQQGVAELARSVPVVAAPSMSQAVNVTMKLAQLAGQALQGVPGGLDVEILERHHRYKQDAPSGTALRFGALLAEATGQDRFVHGRQGQVGARPRNEIAYHAVRVGDNPGEHTVVFGMLGESVELTVRATNRDCYAMGAFAAARFVVDQRPGLYNMFDVLGL